MKYSNLNVTNSPIAYYGVEIHRPGPGTVIVFHSELWREDIKEIKQCRQLMKEALVESALISNDRVKISDEAYDQMLVLAALKPFVDAVLEGDAETTNFYAAVIHKLAGKPNGFTIAVHLDDDDGITSRYEVRPRPFNTYNEAKAAISTLIQAVCEAHEACECDDAEAA